MKDSDTAILVLYPHYIIEWYISNRYKARFSAQHNSIIWFNG